MIYRANNIPGFVIDDHIVGRYDDMFADGLICAYCGEPIASGDDYYDIAGEVYCMAEKYEVAAKEDLWDSEKISHTFMCEL